MAISKTQPMRPAEIELLDVVNGFDSRINSVETEMNQMSGTTEFLEIEVNDIDSRISTVQGEVAQLSATTNTLNTDMATAKANITTLQEDSASANANILELQTDISNAEGDIASLQSAMNALSNVETINYTEYVAATVHVTISSATLKKWGKVCMLLVNYTLETSSPISAGSWKDIFEIQGPYAPISGLAYPASVNDRNAGAMVNNTNAMWIKAYNAAHSGAHYCGVVYLTN